MFVYGAFSNYQKVNSVFSVMTALSAAAPASLARLSAARSAASTSVAATRGPQWKTWQLVAVKTGTVGAIAAGGVAAYMNREAIMRGMRSMKNLNKETIVEGYRSSIGTLGQGLAYINRGNVGKSFAWLSDHFTFVGALLKQKELNRRLERMGTLKGVGIHDFYCSLGENGYWSGGYFVPERTFCAIPEESHSASSLFSRQIIANVEDEVEAHLNMFRPEKNEGYEAMTDKSTELVKKWFLSVDPVIDDPKFREAEPEEAAEDTEVEKALERGDVETEGKSATDSSHEESSEIPDESPIDIAAAASLVPLPSDEGELIADSSTDSIDSEEKRNYMIHLFRVAQQAGTGVKGWIPDKLPQMPTMPTMPSMPKVPTSVPSLPQVSIPGRNLFSKKSTLEEERKDGETNTDQAEVKGPDGASSSNEDEGPKA